QNMVVAVPCPICGSYQKEMSKQMKEEASINYYQIVGAALAGLSFVPLLFGIAHIWILTLALFAIGLGLLVYGYAVALRFDANAGDPEARKALGRKHAIWGEQLIELLGASPGSVGDRDPSSQAVKCKPSWGSAQ